MPKNFAEEGPLLECLQKSYNPSKIVQTIRKKNDYSASTAEVHGRMDQKFN